jgi:thiamine biosynthesis lipoprotein
MLLSLLLSVLALTTAAAPVRAAKPGKANRAAAATGPRVERSLPVMGGTLDLVAASRVDVTDTTHAAAAIELALDEAIRLDQILGPGDGPVELARLNREAATARFGCSEDLYAVLESAVALASETEGAYDPTCGPLEELRLAKPAPDRAAFPAARALVGWRMLFLEPGQRTARFARPGMSVSLGDMGRGYVLDRLAEVLRGRGIVRARLELDDVVLGFTNHYAWTVSVQDWEERPVVSLAISNAACATATGSGPLPPNDRLAAFPPLDPRTGQQILALGSVTVIAPLAARAGALAQALLVMGRDGAGAYAAAHPRLGVIWIEPGGDSRSVQVWAWNLGRIEPASDVRVEWMTHP